MKTFLPVLLCAVIFSTGLQALHAESAYSFSFAIAQKSGGGTKTELYGETTKNQKLHYSITMENKSFKDVQDIEVRYVMFSMQTQPGEVAVGHPNLQRHPGTVSIKLLKNNDKFTFDTEGVMLTSTDYIYGYYADERSKGALRGIWLRVFINGKMVSEYMEPRGLSDREFFDEQPAPKNN